MKYAYDLHAVHVHTTNLQKRKNNDYQTHSNNIHQLYNSGGGGGGGGGDGGDGGDNDDSP